MHPSHRSILEHIRRHGPATVGDLAAATGLAEVTVRHHMAALREQSLVDATSRPAGRGRPRLCYSLSPAGVVAVDEGRAVQMLVADLLAAVKEGAAASLEGLLSSMASGIAGPSAQAVAGAPVPVRLEAAADLLRSRGLAIHWQPSGGGYVVQGEGCPFECLGSVHADLCSLELHILERVVGEQVVREPACAGQASGCTFRVGQA